MKICQCCAAHASAESPHCARCGEASWKCAPVVEPWPDAAPLPEEVAEPVIVPDASVAEEPPAEEPAPAPIDAPSEWPGAYQPPAAAPHVPQFSRRKRGNR